MNNITQEIKKEREKRSFKLEIKPIQIISQILEKDETNRKNIEAILSASSQRLFISRKQYYFSISGDTTCAISPFHLPRNEDLDLTIKLNELLLGDTEYIKECNNSKKLAMALYLMKTQTNKPILNNSLMQEYDINTLFNYKVGKKRLPHQSLLEFLYERFKIFLSGP